MKVRSILGSLGFLALAVLLAACAPEADQQAAESVETAMPEPDASADVLADVRSQYVEHFNLGHGDMVADLYADDAVVLESDGRVLSGRDAIAADLTAVGGMSPNLEVTPEDQISAGDHVVERGRYRIRLTPEGAAEPITATGNFITLSAMQDGAWKIQWLAANADAPSAMPMPAPEAAAAPAEGAAPTADAATAPLTDLSASYAEHFNLGHAEMVADLFTEDAVYMIAERPMVEGRAAIQAAVAERIASGAQVEVTLIEARTLGDEWAIARGHHTLTATAEGESVSRSGEHVILARRQPDGSWKIHWALSTQEPAPTPEM